MPMYTYKYVYGYTYVHTYIHTYIHTSTPQLPFKIPHMPSNRDYKALNRATLGGLGTYIHTCEYEFSVLLGSLTFHAAPPRLRGPGVIRAAPTCSGAPLPKESALNETPQCTSIKGPIVSIRWYLGYLKG